MTRKSDPFRLRGQSVPSAVFLSLLMLCVLLSPPPSRAQVQTGINGTITDLTGAVVAGAHVTATNTSTGVPASAVTSSAGTFSIIGLIPGEYAIVVEATGFKTVKAGLTVEVAKISTTAFQFRPDRPPKPWK